MEELLQRSRPTWHSIAILMSHALFALAIRTAWRRRMFFEVAAMSFSVVISLHYHVCDENITCPFSWSIVTWHALDVWSTFFLISAVLAVMILEPSRWEVAAALRMGYTFWVTVAVWYDRSSVIGLGAILFSVFAAIGYRYFIQKHHHEDLLVLVPASSTATSNPRRGGGGSIAAHASNVVVVRKKFVLRRLIAGVIIFGVALACFMVANAPIHAAVMTYDAARYPPGTLKPMDVPDTAIYWLVHSVWHVASAFAAFFVLRVRE